MRKTNLIIYTSLFFFILSCKKEKIPRNGIHPIQIQNEKAKNSAKADQLFDIEIISLQTPPSSLLSAQAKKIQIIDNEIFIIDPEQIGQVYIFKTDGSFVKKLELKSNDNDTLSYIHNIHFNTEQRVIEIYDKASQEEYFYSFEGELLRSNPSLLEYNFKSFLNQYYTIYDYLGHSNLNWNIDSSDYNTYSLLILENSRKPIANFRPYPPVGDLHQFFTPWKPFYSLGSSLHYYRPFCDTVFKLKAKKIEQKFLLNFTYNPHPRNLLFDPFITNKKAYCEEKVHPFVNQIFESARYLFVFYNYQTNSNLFAFDKIKNMAVLNAQSLQFDKMGLQLPIPLTTNGNERELIRLIPIQEIRPLLEKSRLKGKLPWKYRKLLERLKHSDNLILVRYFLKK